ncbi:MAG: J domain-containing protein, partial [Pseudomonadota bacterium]
SRESAYIELRRRDKSVMFINKQHVLSVAEPVSFQAPKTPDMRPLGSDDAMRFLGVADTATRAELRDAYHQMVKKYHPDRFESADLPDEVVTYLTDMFQKTSTAYELAVASLGAAKAHDPEHHTVEA